MMKFSDRSGCHVQAEFLVFFFCLSLAACSLLMSCSWYLTLTILSVKGSTPSGLPDKKKGKFAWFSHSTETHGNVRLQFVSTLRIFVCVCVYMSLCRLTHNVSLYTSACACLAFFIACAVSSSCTQDNKLFCKSISC